MGASGKHKNRQVHIPATEEQRAAWGRAFRAAGYQSFAEWARATLDTLAESWGFKSSSKVGEESEDE